MSFERFWPHAMIDRAEAAVRVDLEDGDARSRLNGSSQPQRQGQ